MDDVYKFTSKNIKFNKSAKYLPNVCGVSKWKQIFDKTTQHWIAVCCNCQSKLTKKQYATANAAYIKAQLAIKQEKPMDAFIIPNTTNFEALKPYLRKCCFAPQWYRIFHHHANGSSIKCANCMTSLTEEQFNEANNLKLTHDAHHDMINALPNKTAIRVQDTKYEDSVFDYKFEDLELDKGAADVPKCADLDAEELAFLDHRFRTFRKQATKGLKEPKGLKHDQGKIRVALLKRFGLAFLAIADLGTSGAKKYGDHSWTQVPDGINRYDDALFGHFLRESFEGQDPEMKQPHEVATAWNALAKLQLLIELDDVWKARLMKRDAR